MLMLSCTACQKKLSVKDDVAGKKVKCPGCGTVMAVPVAAGIANDRTLSSTSPSQAAQASDPPTNPSLSNPANTLSSEAADSGDESSLTDFLAPPQADDELGRLGKYRILKILGHGGMGVVYQAEDPRLKRTVAIKAMLPTLAASASSGKRFLREAEAMAAVEHDHIVRIYQIDEERGVPFMAMEFLKGQPLDERLKRDKKLPALEVLRIGREIAEALSAAHAKGLIHRDIKPANIWLEAPRDRVKILDFGLARAAAQESGLTQQGAIIGTPAFMAPEQARGDAVDARTDLFSLGAVLYRLSTGQQPFQGNDTVSMLMDVATRQPTAPGTINVDLPQQLSELVMKLLEKDPAKRIASADKVVHALERMEKDLARQQAAREQTLAETYLPATQTGRGADDESAPRRRKLPRVLAALLLLGLLGGGTLAVIVLFWRTSNGVVRIEINDPDIEVAFSKTGAVIKGADKHNIALAAGEHFLNIKRGDLQFDTDKFILKKGETITLKIEWFKDGKLQVVQDGKVIKEKALAKAGPEKLITNTLGMTLVYIRPGKFTMGSSPQEIERCLRIGDWAKDDLPAEGPEHPVEITQGFYLGATEVTVGQFRKFVEAKKYTVGDDRWNPASRDFEDVPVAWVTWQNAVDFCNWLSEKEGKQYRLPTEAQWEYSCRAGKAGTRYSFGDDESELENYAWYAKNSPKGRNPVAKLKPNEWGLYDMHGSMWEWCQDLYDADYYKTSPKQDPQGPAGAGGKHVIRGGSHFDHLPYVCRSAFRFYGDPGTRSFNYGFRVLLAPDGVKPRAPLPQTHAMIQKFQGHAGPIYSVALSGDGKHVLTGSGDKTAVLFDATDGKKLQTFQGHTDVVGSAVLSSDARHVITGSHDHTAGLWDAETGKKIQTFAGHNASVRGVALSGDGKHVLTGSYDQTAALWDADSGKRIQTFTGHTHEVWCVALSSDAKLVLTGARDNTAILWDAATAKKIQTFQGHTDGLQSVALSRDGKRVLTGSWDSTAILWDASSGKPLQTFRGHSGRVTGVALSDDDSLVLTGSLDNSAIVWDATTGKKLQILQGHTGPVEHAAMTGDAKLILTGAQDQQAILWRLGH